MLERRINPGILHAFNQLPVSEMTTMERPSIRGRHRNTYFMASRIMAPNGSIFFDLSVMGDTIETRREVIQDFKDTLGNPISSSEDQEFGGTSAVYWISRISTSEPSR